MSSSMLLGIMLLCVGSVGTADPTSSVRVEAVPDVGIEPSGDVWGEMVPLRECCECLVTPDVEAPSWEVGDCVWVPADQPCRAPYIDRADCAALADPGQGPSEPPSYLVPGDLLFIEAKPWVQAVFGVGLDGWDHIAMYIGDGTFVEASDYPGLSEVATLPFAFYRTWGAELVFGRVVTADENQRAGAVDFALRRRGYPYQHCEDCWWANPNPGDPNDPHSDAWYCSELVWAAYWHQGINIDVTPEPPSPDEGGDGVHLFVSPQDIADDDDVDVYLNGPPSVPTCPSGPTSVYRLQTAVYTSVSYDLEGDLIRYQWDWGEGLDLWGLYLPSGVQTTRPHTWLTLGSHSVRVRAEDSHGNQSGWSPPLVVYVSPW